MRGRVILVSSWKMFGAACGSQPLGEQQGIRDMFNDWEILYVKDERSMLGSQVQ